VRGLGVSFFVRRARASWLLLACVAVTVLLATAVAAVLWTFAAAVIPFGAQGILADPAGRVMGFNGPVDAGQAAADSQQIRAKLRQAWPGVAVQLESARWTQPLQLPPLAGGTTIRQIQLASLEGFSSRATLTAGSWPGPPHRGGPVPVALPAAAASQLNLTVGSVLTAAPASGGTATSIRVTGLFRARNPASAYWALDLLPVSGVSVQRLSASLFGSSTSQTTVSAGPAVVNPAAFGGALTVSQASWTVLPPAPVLARGNLEALAANTDAAIAQLSVLLPKGLNVTSSLPQRLDGIASTVVLTRSLFTIAALQLLLVAGAGLVLAARLLASMREEESALLRARGATTWQVVRPVLAEAAVLGVSAGLAGVLIGTRLTPVLARLAGLRLGGYTDHGITPLAWLSALAMLVLCVAVMAWPALHSPTPDAARLRRGRQARLAGIAGAGGDLALVALAAVAVWELHGYSAVAHPATGSLGIDPVVAIAPALALAGLALIPLRGLPLLARLADRASDHGRRLAAAMVSWQIARRPIRQAGPALLVVIATATTTLALAGYASWRQSAADQAAFAVGSDVRVDSATGLPLGATGTISAAPGVTAAAAASLTSIGNGGQLIALEASTARRAVLLRPDLSVLPLSTLWRRITPLRPAGVALPGEPDRLAVVASLGAASPSRPAQVRRELGSATVTAWIQDAGGGTYQVPAAGLLPADGRPHALVVTLSGSHQASYPVRLFGLTLSYVLPPYDRANPQSSPTAGFRVESLAVAGTAAGPFSPPFSNGAAFTSWPGTGSSLAVPAGAPYPGGGGPLPPNGAPPAVLGWHRAAGGVRQLTFSAGHDPSPQVEHRLDFDAAIATGQVTIMAQAPGQDVPAIATAGYLTANRLGVGSLVSVTLDSITVTIRIVASVADFPAVSGPNQALVVDLPEVNEMLANARVQLNAPQVTPLPVTRWWLRTAGGRVPRLPAGLGLSVADRASQRAALLGNPLLTSPRQAMLAVGVAAVLLGAGGFSVSVAGSLRSRRTQSAVFAALGVGPNAQAGQLCLEQLALSLPAAAAGLLAGIGLAHLMVPAITLTADSAAPVPWALVILPLGPAVALAFVTAALPVAAAALSVLRRPDPAAQLRAEAG
jgi:ABC-type antimicrobial peptide transport system permease subunit